MAILQIVDQLADMLNRGWQVPLSQYRIVDAGEFGKMLERMRITVPSSIKESERTLAERDAILAEAHQEAERIIQEAKQRATELMSQEAIVSSAQQEVDRVIEEGRRIARQHTSEADRYATQVLQDLSQRLQNALRQVDNGLQVMQVPNNSQPTEHFDELENAVGPPREPPTAA